MMPADILKFLEYGVLGFCAITLILVWRILQTEQKLIKPRKTILNFSYIFMGFCFALAVLNGYVQLNEREIPKEVTEKVTSLQNQLRENQDKLLEIKSATAPLLDVKNNILGKLPPGNERDTLIDIANKLRTVLE